MEMHPKKISRIALFLGVVLMCTVQPAWCTPWTPMEWQEKGKLRTWVRDADRNFIDDLIDADIVSGPPDQKIGILVAFNRCVTEPGNPEALEFLDGIGRVAYVGRIVTFAVVEDVALSDIPALAARPEVAMVERYVPVVPNLNYSTRAVRMHAGPFGPLPFTYSLETIEDSRPDLMGAGINIAVIDSGVDNGHESLTGSFVGGADCTDFGHPGACVSRDPDDENGHGTHVAGIALGRGAPDGTRRGVAEGAGLIDVKIFRGPNNFNPVGATEAALEWVILNSNADWGGGRSRGIQVANMSFSGCDTSDGLSVRDQLVNAMVARGILVVVSVGNRNGECGDPSTGLVNRIPSIAAASLAVSTANSVVGSLTVSPTEFSFQPTVDRSDDEVFFDSLRGPRSDGGTKPELAAPGTAIQSAEFDTVGGYTLKVGTSMSAPHVAGLAGVLLQATPDINPGSLKDLFIRTAHRPAEPTPDVNTPVWDADWGYGLVDGYEALRRLTGQGEARTDLTFQGFGGEPHPYDPIWESPAIRFNYGTDHEDVLRLGSPNEISIRVLNRDRDASNVRVVLGIYYFAASDPDRPQFYEIASLTSDLPRGITDLSHSWTPSRDFDLFAEPDAHICIRVSLDYGLDFDYSRHSNVAQRNLKRVAIGSPAVFRFRVENPLPEKAVIHLDVRPRDKNPPGWTFSLSENDFELDPAACARNVELTVTPPAGVQPGVEATYRVHAWALPGEDDPTPLGGLTAVAFVPKRPVAPYGRIVLVLVAAALLLALAGYTLVTKHRGK